MKLQSTEKSKPIALSIEEVRNETGLGRTKLYQLINSGNLIARKIGRRTVVLRSDLETFLCGLQLCTPKAPR
ncbi:MAG: helix-turn-helix domain-containing protein [Alphaproteobacteria bacterium]|nr:helix-turn-helix domain-containing protein [Alphaproteobacteria bacterium]MCL2505851.1 helix-turn-helix domain-containing protein [Alphaproteobacteria bacterium]